MMEFANPTKVKYFVPKRCVYELNSWS